MSITISKLTPRETQVLLLLIQDNTNDEIAKYLGISRRTVEIHRSNIIRSLNLYSYRDQLKKYAIDNGLI